MVSLSGADLSSVAGMVISLVTTFLTVAYLVANGSEAVSTLLQWREKMLMAGVGRLLDDTDIDGLALALYNSIRFNPGGDGKARRAAELTAKPTAVEPDVFANALLHVLRLSPKMSAGDMRSAIESLPVEQSQTPDAGDLQRRLASLGAPRSDQPIPSISQNIRNLSLNVIHETNGQWDAIVTHTADWFAFAASHWMVNYQIRMRYTSFILGFLLAAFLDLEPLATVTSALGKPEAASAGTAIGHAWVLASKVIEWTIVATSTLFGAPFWYSLLLKITGKAAPKTSDGPTAPPKPPSLNGGTTASGGSMTGPTGPVAGPRPT